jgi:hypothetical protein
MTEDKVYQMVVAISEDQSKQMMVGDLSGPPFLR